jgi:hypothetical protein
MPTTPLLQALKLIAALGISDMQFCANTGFPAEALSSNHNVADANRIESVVTIFRKLEPWFDYRQDSWIWYTNHPLSGFGKLSASEVVQQNQGAGIAAILAYIKSMELGSFE